MSTKRMVSYLKDHHHL